MLTIDEWYILIINTKNQPYVKELSTHIRILVWLAGGSLILWLLDIAWKVYRHTSSLANLTKQYVLNNSNSIAYNKLASTILGFSTVLASTSEMLAIPIKISRISASRLGSVRWVLADDDVVVVVVVVIVGNTMQWTFFVSKTPVIAINIQCMAHNRHC